MNTFRDTTPASLRKPVESSRFVYNLMTRAQRPAAVDADTRAGALAKSRFARLPNEPEDAKLTGTTRSLQRRLMALNVPSVRTATEDMFRRIA